MEKEERHMGIRNYFILLVAAAVFCVHSAAPVQAADDTDKAKAFVATTADEVFKILKSSGKKSQTKALEKMIRAHVDIPWIGQFVMGRFWRQATDEQKAKYLKNYEDFIASTYASRFTEYKGDGFTITDARSDNNNKYTVKMSIKTEAEPILVDYKVRKNDGGKFKIYDLNVEGVSLITTQRSEFAAILQNKGIDNLIAQLGDKTESMLLVKQK